MNLLSTRSIEQNLERSVKGRDLLCAANIQAGRDFWKEKAENFKKLLDALLNKGSDPDELRRLIAQARLAIVQLEIYNGCSHTADLYVKEELEKINLSDLPVFKESDFPEIDFKIADPFDYWGSLSCKEKQPIFWQLLAERKRKK